MKLASRVLPPTVAILGFIISRSDATLEQTKEELIEKAQRRAAETYTSVFLFAGQSNMLGYPGETGCQYTMQSGAGECNDQGKPEVFPKYKSGFGITENTIRGQDLDSIAAILRAGYPHAQAFRKLKEQLLKVDLAESDDFLVAEWQAANMLYLHSTFPDLFRAMTTEHDSIYCSLTYPDALASQQVLDEGRKLSIEAHCGEPWGLEQSFAHTFASSNNYAIAKVAAGGTTMKDDWYPSASAYCWQALRAQVHNIAGAHPNCPRGSDGSACKWKGLVFFQGENDMFENSFQAKLYGRRLNRFVAGARRQMFLAGSDTSFSTAKGIPVVIVQLGCWAATLEGENGQIIMEEQSNFVKQDGNAALVRTDDLSCFYHLDPASLVIIGVRVAEAMDALLGSPTSRCSPKEGLCYNTEDCCGSLDCNEFHQCKE